MIDTHAHIGPEDEIKIAGLEKVVLSASNLVDSMSNIQLAQENQILLASVGIHPQDVPVDIDDSLTRLDELLIQSKEIVAVGECGMDFSSEFDLADQVKLFKGQIELAKKHNKTLIVHSRKAMDETIELLGQYRDLRGVIHCYSGGKKRINSIVNLDGEWFFGIDGNLTYESGLQEVMINIPKNRLVLETDSPALTPIPFRGEKNYPENVKYVYQKVAELWKTSPEEAESQIDQNARRLFQIL
jgi:TatD DNase family protein